MKIAVIGTDFTPMHGGIASWASDVATALAQRNHEVYVISRVPKDPNKPFNMIQCVGRSWNTHRAKWIALSTLRLPSIDVAIFATWDCASWAAPRLRRAQTTVLCAAHGSDITRDAIPIKTIQKTALSIDHWIPVSQFLAKTLNDLLPSAQSTVLPYPLEAKEKPRPSNPNGPLLCLARLVTSKNLSATAELTQQLGRTLWICGDGPLKEKLQKTLHSSSKILGHIPRTELDALYQQASGVILCAKTNDNGFGAEGLGLCLLEAAARGIPTLGTNIGGIPEALGPGLIIDLQDPDLAAIEHHLMSEQIPQQTWDWFKQNHGTHQFCDAFEALICALQS